MVIISSRENSRIRGDDASLGEQFNFGLVTSSSPLQMSREHSQKKLATFGHDQYNTFQHHDD